MPREESASRGEMGKGDRVLVSSQMIIVFDKTGIIVKFGESYFNRVLGPGIWIFNKNLRWFVRRMTSENTEQ